MKIFSKDIFRKVNYALVFAIEAMAQAGGVLILSTVPDPQNYLTFFAKIDSPKFKFPAVPGDTNFQM